jgi:hypothetical protein
MVEVDYLGVEENNKVEQLDSHVRWVGVLVRNEVIATEIVNLDTWTLKMS